MADSGAPGAMSGAPPAPNNRLVKLEKENELRIEATKDTPLHLILLEGTAEIFGTELDPQTRLTFPPHSKFAVFTWYGATIEMDGPTMRCYIANETPMISYANVNAMLNGRRNLAKSSESCQGPRVIVVGPTDCGKRSLSRMLVGWGAKQGWIPTFVDLDIGQGSVTAPGCIGATPVGLPIDQFEGFLAYFYGHTTPTQNVELYKTLVKELSQKLDKLFTRNAECRAAGMVISTMGWVQGVGNELILHAIETFNVNVALVLGQEELVNMLKDRKPNVHVVKLDKSDGVVSRTANFRHISRSIRIRQYFYGFANDLAPHSCVVNFDDLSVYRIIGGAQPQASRSTVQIGAVPVANPLGVTAANIGPGLLYAVLAVSCAQTPQQILLSNIAGFIHVTDIDLHRRKITYLSRTAGELPGKYLIMGTLAWIET